jgi:group I intron endonuclease
MGIIYSYKNLINGKQYIGQTINPEQRFKQHKSSAFNEKDKDYNSLLHRAFRKYGYDNFEYTVLAETDDIDILNELEIAFIKKYNTKVPYGYNIEDGGRNCKKPQTEEQKRKLMEAHASLSKEEVIELRLAYKNNESPKKIYDEKYKDRLHYNSFLNIWSGRRYSSIMPEVINNGRHTKITAEIAKAIRKDREETKLSYQKIAEKYNISKSTVADIVNKRTWKNV